MRSDLGDAHAAYLQRLGLTAEPPSVEALFRIHRAHVERVPYETVWIHTGERRGIDPTESIRQIARGRGGYCFQLNGALAELLVALGYAVTRHVGGVHGPTGASEDEMGNHLVLLVHDLTDSSGDDVAWYVDVGLGDALHEPMPLRPHTAVQGPFRLALEATRGGVGDWHLAHDPSGGFSGMAWRDAPVAIDAFASRHVHLSTSPESGFVRVLTAQRRDATGVDVLRGLTLRRVGAGGSTETLTSSDELVAALGDVFGLDLADLGRRGTDALWRRVHDAHVAWEASGRP